MSLVFWRLLSPRFASVFFVLLLTAVAAPLHAQEHAQEQGANRNVDPTGDPAQDLSPSYEALFREGVEALRLVQFEAAAAYFRQSLNARPMAKAACNLALTFDRWGAHEAEARDAYIRCAELDTSGRFRDHALARAAALRELVTRRAPRPEQTDDDRDMDPVPDPNPVAGSHVERRPPAEEHDARGLLWAGIALSVTSVAVLASAVAPTTSANADADVILERYPDRRIPADDAIYLRLNEEFERKRRVATALFIAGGGLALMGVTFVIADIVRHGRRPRVETALVPTAGGAMAMGRVEF